MPAGRYRGPLPAADQKLLNLADDLRKHVVCLAEEIGERNVRYRPHQLDRAADYVGSQFAGAGLTASRQHYVVSGRKCCNVEVEIPGATAQQEVVVIGAHYDSVHGSPAANDNASGVAAILCLADRFAHRTIGRTLRFVAFVNEEEPYAHTEQMGSWVYARRCRERNESVMAMLSLETIGYYSDEPGSQRYPRPLRKLYPSTGDFIAFVGNTRHARLVRSVLGTFRRAEPFPSEGGALPESLSDASRSDHWSFWQQGYPALMVTDTAPFRYPHYHTAEDTPDKIDFERTARVVRGLTHVIADLAAAR
jgi:Zn-dependent M28 family amino/carboxypeptidase